MTCSSSLSIGAGRSGRGCAEILEVGGGKDQHLARAVGAIDVVALAGLHHAGPAGEVRRLAARLLGEEIVGDAHGELAVGMQLLDDLVVLRIVLEAAAGVDHAGDAEAIELAHEVARRVELHFGRQLRPLGQRAVEDRGIGLGKQQARRVAPGVAHDLAAWRIGRVLGVADNAQRGGVQERAVVEVQDEHRRLGRSGVDLLEGRQALLGELLLGEAADHAHPLRRRRVLAPGASASPSRRRASARHPSAAPCCS